MFKKSVLLCAIVVVFFCVCPTQVYALQVGFDPAGSLDVDVGSSFTIDLIADIGVDEQILGWDIDLAFDDSQVSFTGATATVGGDWMVVDSLGDDDVGIAGLGPYGLPPDTGIYGDGVVLATLSFECIAEGTSTIDIFTDDPLEGFQLAESLGYADWSSEALTVNQTNPIPEPATFLLLGFGLMGLIGFRRKSKKK